MSKRGPVMGPLQNHSAGLGQQELRMGMDKNQPVKIAIEPVKKEVQFYFIQVMIRTC